jgi:hypothetical protein
LRSANDSIIITVDDDVIYPADFVDNLVKMHRKHPDCVCYYWGLRIATDIRERLTSPNKWKESNREYIPSLINYAVGSGGVLYPPGCFHDDTTNAALFMKYAPTGDDIWFKVMTLLKNVRYVRTPIESRFEDKFIFLKNAQDIGLYHINTGKYGNNNGKQIEAVSEAYHLNWKSIEMDEIRRME